MASRKKALAGMLEATREASKKFRKKDLSMAEAMIAGASSAKARDERYGTQEHPTKPGVRIPKQETSERDKDATRKLAKIRTRARY